MLAFLIGMFLVPNEADTPPAQPIPICTQALEEKQPNQRKSLLLQCAEQTSDPAIRSLAYINLGTLTFHQHDISNAAKFYNLAEQEGMSLSSDPFFHAYRSSVNSQLGYHKKAVSDAQKVLDYLQQNPNSPDGLQTQLFEQIIVPLHRARAIKLENQALESFLALPVTNWIDAINRAGLLIETKRYQQAVPFVEQAYQEQPNHPASLNSKCYLLGLTDRAAEAIPYCEKAMQIAPDTAPILHSYAFALAKSGHCLQSQTALNQAQKIEPSVAVYQNKIPCEQVTK